MRQAFVSVHLRARRQNEAIGTRASGEDQVALLLRKELPATETGAGRAIVLFSSLNEDYGVTERDRLTRDTRGLKVEFVTADGYDLTVCPGLGASAKIGKSSDMDGSGSRQGLRRGKKDSCQARKKNKFVHLVLLQLLGKNNTLLSSSV